MTGAELKTIRESLGLTAKWLADKAGVAHRSAQYWEAQTFNVPDDVASLINNLDLELEKMVVNGIKTLSEKVQSQGGWSERVVLLRYSKEEDLWRFHPEMKGLPVTYHAAMLARLRSVIIGLQIPCVIVWMDVGDYLAWLGDREDSEAMRSAWAVANLD